MITYGQALTKVAERTYDNREYMKRILTQRRNTPTNIYGIPFDSEIDSQKRFQCHISILPNLEYFTRFQFKLYVDNVQGTINPNLFKFEIGDPVAFNEQTQQEESIIRDLTPYLEEQQNEWVDGAGWYPSISFNDDEAGDYYDVLDACGLLYAENDIEGYDAILSSGNKVIIISSNVPCDISFIPYISYTTVNR